MRLIFLLILGAFVAGVVYVRLAPINAAYWNVVPDTKAPFDDLQSDSFRAVRMITASPSDVLSTLQAIALKTPRTRLVAGSIDAGLLTFETRSKVVGFPDYTTAAVTPQGEFVIYGRLRYGVADLGVNAARVQDWLAQMGPLLAAHP